MVTCGVSLRGEQVEKVHMYIYSTTDRLDSLKSFRLLPCGCESHLSLSKRSPYASDCR